MRRSKEELCRREKERISNMFQNHKINKESKGDEKALNGAWKCSTFFREVYLNSFPLSRWLRGLIFW